MLKTAFFLFKDSLNDFLSRELKNEVVGYSFTGKPSVKDAFEAIGIPHTEVAIIRINGKFSDYECRIDDFDKIEIFPQVHSFSNSYSLLQMPLVPDFILDVHLGKLAKYLRLLGFDCFYKNDLSDTEIASVSVSENRVVLSRDKGLLKQKKIKLGYWLRSQDTSEQLKEVLNYFNISDKIKPFSRCMICNNLLEKVTKESIQNQLQPKTKVYFEEFYRCTGCSKIYWKGSHYDKMLQLIKSLA